MLFNLPNDSERFKFKVNQALEKGGIHELTERRPKRTLSQNKYLHVLISLYSIEIGLTRSESKTDLKRECEFMVYVKNGNKYLLSSAGLDTKGLYNWIEWIKDYAGRKGIYLPSPEDYKRNWEAIENEIEAHKQYIS